MGAVGFASAVGVAASRGDAMRFAREARKLTQREAATLVGCSLSEISRYECGHVQPKLERVARMARAYGVSMESLLGGGSDA